MELRLNNEGVQYVIGLPVRDDPALFSQVVLTPGELKWLPSEVTVTGFSSLAEARRARDEIQDRLAGSPRLYQVTINRLEAE
jgi:hypothetical protein